MATNDDALQPARSTFDRLKAKPGERRLGDLSPDERQKFDESIAAVFQCSQDKRRDWLRSHSLPDDVWEALQIVLNDIETDLDPTLLDDVPLDNAIKVIDMAVKRERWRSRLSSSRTK